MNFKNGAINNRYSINSVKIICNKTLYASYKNHKKKLISQ